MSDPEPSMHFMLVAGCAAAVCWVLALCEFLGALHFSPWAFRLGLCVRRESRRLPVPTTAAFETPTARFAVVGPGVCLFRWKMDLFFSDFRTPSLIKGTIRWEGDQATVEIRYPLFGSLFACCALVGWMGQGIWMHLTSDAVGASGAGIFLLLTGLILGALCVFSIQSEIHRSRLILSEYEALVTSPPPAESKSVDEFGQIHRADDSRRRLEATEADRGGHR
jgi:hypothetical protein